MNLFWFLPSGLWFFASSMHAVFSVFFTGRAMIASFLEQKFWVVASWMII
jgi:hypothetical protein